MTVVFIACDVLSLQAGLDALCGLGQTLLRHTERYADEVVALAAEDAARRSEDVALVEDLVREGEAVAVEPVGDLGPDEESGLSLLVLASQRVEQFVTLCLTCVVYLVEGLKPILSQRESLGGGSLYG